ncbi:hypothetical protein LIER_29994 [Lithospermum erythrorhizon]|uniref:Uncharacterized protein n=1 Tax=Lithospermum erythrorhizon TaxID=34254 RepID=A0AAV3RLH8_LITER
MTIDTEYNVNIAYAYIDLNQVTSRSKHGYLGAAGYSLDRDRYKYPATSLGKCERVVLSLLHHNVVPANLDFPAFWCTSRFSLVSGTEEDGI